MAANRWFILSMLFLVRAAMGFQFQTVGSLAPVLVDAFAIDYARLGTLIGLYLLPGVIIALPGGMLGDRFGALRVALAGLGLMALGGGLMAVSGSFTMLVAGRLIGGTGAVLMNIVVTRMVADWFVGRELRTAMGVLVASWPAGIALGLAVFAPLAAWLGWQAVMLIAAAVCLLQLLVLAATYRDPPEAVAQTAAPAALDLTRREWTLVLIAGFVWGVYNVAYIVLVSFVPTLFTGQGYSLAQANGIASLLGWALIVMVPVGGYLADRSGRPDAVMIAGFAVTAAATMLLPFPAATAIAFAVVLLAAGLPAGAIMALPAAALRAENRAVGMGVYFTCYYGFMAGFPALAGLARDLSNNEAAPVWFAAAMVIAAMAGVVAFRLASHTPIRN